MKTETYFVVGCILILLGITMLLIVSLLYVLYPSNYGMNFDTLRIPISASIVLIVVGIGILAVSLRIESDS